MSATLTSQATKIQIKILRQEGAGKDKTWDTFEIPYIENMNIISALIEIQKNPVTTDGRKVRPVAYEAACLEEVCGSCTMNINGGIRQACTALIEDNATLEGDTFFCTLEPMKKFPIVRDLIVDRSQMFENLKKVQAWVPIDGSYDLGMAQPQDDNVRMLRYALSRCMTCGCCMEACPQVNEKSPFVGPAALGQALLFSQHPVGKTLDADRYEFLTSESGLSGCGNAQNCVKVCPKAVPLTRAIAQLNRDTTVYKLKKWVGLVG
jgi:succinate dehydrogenase / fumarate reductase, iron-sulfur subunit